MHKRHKHDLIALFAVLALSIALYLSISHYLGFTVKCDITKGCEDVLNSKYAMLFGLPLAVWGVGFFSAVFISALLANYYKKWRVILTCLLGIGTVGALIFLSIQFFVLKKVCQYCLTTDTLTILMFLWDLNVEHQSQAQTLP